eukprot:CAMPEP_0170545234 /NCGR_PEP_ID=MMETSP0211-20121228/3697_1 /TAXON_ID=311385 /ORGANISM="Pseudokeronopsis sp., Strain OXSARD2" /LENGTH=203 /DNA_ID=CAMNT_0010849087 /DNA_START=161 /DNA_END=772 /DNA_ORIENTATION=-
MAFNLSVSCTLLVKVIAGMFFFNKHSHRALRTFFIVRLSVDLFIYLPLHYVFRELTATYVISFFLGLGSVIFIELIALCLFRRELYKKGVIESIEDIEGSKITHHSINDKNVVIEMNIKLAGKNLKRKYNFTKLKEQFKEQEMENLRGSRTQDLSKGPELQKKTAYQFENRIELTNKWYQEHIGKRSEKVRLQALGKENTPLF